MSDQNSTYRLLFRLSDLPSSDSGPSWADNPFLMFGREIVDPRLTKLGDKARNALPNREFSAGEFVRAASDFVDAVRELLEVAFRQHGALLTTEGRKQVQYQNDEIRSYWRELSCDGSAPQIPEHPVAEVLLLQRPEVIAELEAACASTLGVINSVIEGVDLAARVALVARRELFATACRQLIDDSTSPATWRSLYGLPQPSALECMAGTLRAVQDWVARQPVSGSAAATLLDTLPAAPHRDFPQILRELRRQFYE